MSAWLFGNVSVLQVANTLNNKWHCSLPALTQVFPTSFYRLARGPNQRACTLREGFPKISAHSRVHILFSLQNHNPDRYRLKMEMSCWDQVSSLKEDIPLLTSSQGYVNKISASEVQMRKRHKKNILLVAQLMEMCPESGNKQVTLYLELIKHY